MKVARLPSELVDVAVRRKLDRRVVGEAQITVPCVPEMREHYIGLFAKLFESYGKPFTKGELDDLRKLVADHLEQGFAESPYATMTMRMNTEPPPSPGIGYLLTRHVPTMEDQYEDWVREREPPLFGEHADRKLLHVAAALGLPVTVPILDVGAGTGRNTLPLARDGYRVDAVEPVAAMATQIEAALRAEKLPGKVYVGDAASPALGLPKEHYRLIVLAEVIASHTRSAAELRALLVALSASLAPGGKLLFNAFFPQGDYTPSLAVRQFSQVVWSCVLTYGELKSALQGLPLTVVSDEPVYDYERAHLSDEQWPPTGWFPDWARGLDIVDLPPERSPIALRWIVLEKGAKTGK
jgi:SAM-dependent methyltransferase